MKTLTLLFTLFFVGAGSSEEVRTSIFHSDQYPQGSIALLKGRCADQPSEILEVRNRKGELTSKILIYEISVIKVLRDFADKEYSVPGLPGHKFESHNIDEKISVILVQGAIETEVRSSLAGQEILLSIRRTSIFPHYFNALDARSAASKEALDDFNTRVRVQN